MKYKRLTPVLASVLVALAGLSSAPAQDAPPKSPYYPLKVGTTWHYSASGKKIVVRVVAHEKVGDVPCAKVEATEKGTTKVEYIGVEPDGLYRYQVKDKEIKPPLCFLKLSPEKGTPEKGTSWKVAS